MMKDFTGLDPKKHTLISPRTYAYTMASTLRDGMMIYLDKQLPEGKGYDLKLKESILDHAERYNIPFIKLNIAVVRHIYQFCSLLTICKSERYMRDYGFPILETCIFYAMRPIKEHQKCIWINHAFSNTIPRVRELTKSRNYRKLEKLRDYRYLKYS